MCVVVGYPVAYYTARLAGKRRGLVLALILAPWWINYITRMLAWVNLLQDDGYVNKTLGVFGVAPVSWLSGNSFTVVVALAYGYVPYFIVPLFASLDRIDQRLLEASRDLGVGAVRTFLHVTLPLSKMGPPRPWSSPRCRSRVTTTRTRSSPAPRTPPWSATRSSCSCSKVRRRTSAPPWCCCSPSC